MCEWSIWLEVGHVSESVRFLSPLAEYVGQLICGPPGHDLPMRSYSSPWEIRLRSGCERAFWNATCPLSSLWMRCLRPGSSGRRYSVQSLCVEIHFNYEQVKITSRCTNIPLPHLTHTSFRIIFPPTLSLASVDLCHQLYLFFYHILYHIIVIQGRADQVSLYAVLSPWGVATMFSQFLSSLIYKFKSNLSKGISNSMLPGTHTYFLVLHYFHPLYCTAAP